jgi:Fe-S oxidoreductases
MATILFEDIVFGPIKSRRLGTSLGVNLAPRHGKVCNFDCIYCECGFNKDGKKDNRVPQREDVAAALEDKLKSYTGDKIDTITFSGNGEPTIHPNFAEIIDDTIRLRNIYAPQTKISVLTNGTRIGRQEVREALLKIENAIVKIDSAIDKTARLIDRPLYPYSLSEVIKELIPFRGKFVLQTMFLRGEFEKETIDNTTQQELNAWYGVVDKIEPGEIMIYTIDRETPADKLQKVSVEEMEKIAAPLKKRGIKVSISG